MVPKKLSNENAPEMKFEFEEIGKRTRINDNFHTLLSLRESEKFYSRFISS